MLTTLLNITKLTNEPGLLYKFWATPTLMYISSVYAFCLLVISLCMYSNRRDNLIYKVLNLAVLSVFVVALWSYLTDVTFIYVVYILTFVSAVVMLFLSVVLMLPSSAVSIPKRSSLLLLFGTEPMSYFSMFLIIVSLIALLYLLYCLYEFVSGSKTQQKYGEPGQVLESLPYTSDATTSDFGLHTNTGILWDHYTAFVYSDESTNTSILQELQNQQENLFTLPIVLLSKNQEKKFPLYIKLVPKLLATKRWAQLPLFQNWLLIIYEFTRHFFKYLSTNFGIVFGRLPEGLLKFLHLSLPAHKEDSSSWFFNQYTTFAKCQVSNGQGSQSYAILEIFHPWWSPYNLFRAQTSSKFLYERPQKSFRDKILTFWQNVIPSTLRHDMMDKIVISSLSKVLDNYVLPIFSSRFAETVLQVLASWSIFLLAVPQGQFATTKFEYAATCANFQAPGGSTENLASIQYELYVASPLLMIVCVVGLLVALIGAALLVSTKVLNSK